LGGAGRTAAGAFASEGEHDAAGFSIGALILPGVRLLA
jgi:hypothetical protein